MAVRIYALAKELKVDSKELVDICTKAGVPGKGSALASLTEEEVEKVKQFLKGGGTAKAKPAKAAPVAPQRPTEPARAGKMPVIVTPKPARPTRVQAGRNGRADEADEPVEEPDGDRSPIAATAAASKRPLQSTRRAALARWLARWVAREYIGPGAASGKVPVVGAEATTAAIARRADGSTAERPRPAVKLAPMPKSRQPSAEPASQRAAAQKPDCGCRPTLWAPANRAASRWRRTCSRHERTLEEEKKQRGLKGLRPPGTPRASACGTEEERRDKASAAAAKERRAKSEEDGKPMLGGREQRQLARRRTPTTDGEDDRPQRFGRRPRRR